MMGDPWTSCDVCAADADRGLRPAESMVVTMAKSQIARGADIGSNTTAFLVAIIDRLTGASDWMDDDE